MAKFVYERGQRVETIEADADDFEYHHSHDHWIVKVDETDDGEDEIIWIPRNRLYEVRGAKSSFDIFG